MDLITKELIQKYSNNVTAFFVNAIEVMGFQREALLPRFTEPLFGKLYNKFILLLILALYRNQLCRVTRSSSHVESSGTVSTWTLRAQY
jgi:hypothetical protein